MNAELTGLENSTDQRNLVTFRLDQQTYALPIEPIVQIIEMVTITSVPQVSNAVEGVINVRGMLVPVINLHRHLGLPKVAPQLHTPIILAQIGEQMVGLIVDEVLDVLSLPGDQITHPADMLPEGLGEVSIIKGLAYTPDGMVLLFDLDHLFLPHQAQALAQAVETLPDVLVEEASEGEKAAPAEAEPQSARPRRKKRQRTPVLSPDERKKASREMHLDEADREVRS